MTAGGADSGCRGERKAALGSGPVSVEGRRRRAASRAHEGPAGRRRETPRRQAHVRARVVSGKTRRSKLPFWSAEDAAGRRTKMRGDGRLLALPRTEASKSAARLHKGERRHGAHAGFLDSRVTRAADSGLRAGGGRRPCVSPPRLGWDLGGRLQARGPPPDPCSSRAWTPAGRVKQVQDTQCGGKTRPDGDTGTLCVHRPP